MAFEHSGTSSSEVWKTVVDTSNWAFNWVIGAATMVPRILLATWRLIPAGVAQIFVTAVNYGIRSINALIEKTIAGVNGFVGQPMAYSAGLVFRSRQRLLRKLPSWPTVMQDPA